MDMYTLTNWRQALWELIEYYGNPPTILAGHSRGGSMSMLVGAEHPDVRGFMAAMARPAGSTPKDRTAEEEITYREKPGGSGELVELRFQSTFFKDAEEHDALPGLRKSRKPKLLIYGSEDKVITEETVRSTFNAAAEPKHLIGIEGATHNYRHNSAHIIALNKHFRQFVQIYWPTRVH